MKITVKHNERGDYHLTLTHYVSEGWRFVEKDDETVTFTNDPETPWKAVKDAPEGKSVILAVDNGEGKVSSEVGYRVGDSFSLETSGEMVIEEDKVLGWMELPVW